MSEDSSVKLKYSFRLKESEAILFQQKLKETNTKNESEFIRLCLSETEIIVIDEDLKREKVKLFSKISNNLNQAIKTLHIDRKKANLNDDMYSKLLTELEYLNQVSAMILKKD